ncbi:hypothetical protein MAFF211521_24380 [Ralstonia pseudosolanacearum]|nr:hypothetical protein MAFF211521_24380 [Ralstonia pseudosolanacearum]
MRSCREESHGMNRGHLHLTQKMGGYMALVKNMQRLTPSDSQAFDVRHNPGTTAPHPGIYRCTSCGDEIAIAGGHTLPPQNHKQHSPANGPIHWQLLVYPQQG